MYGKNIGTAAVQGVRAGESLHATWPARDVNTLGGSACARCTNLVCRASRLCAHAHASRGDSARARGAGCAAAGAVVVPSADG
ncbi:UNVERIFIED_CONTAM: hypothetical protein Slati_1423700 [Sesamum latifolium]|uniref:Uncharacterized protein n=1 Tax=Sesamum latifolium TaxID=2727402 RepID=A0AAW2X4K3_9LAMI